MAKHSLSARAGKAAGRRTAKAANGRPSKPHRDFPLTPHPAGQWCKKIRGRLHYFGRWTNDPKGQAALELWLEQKDDLLTGRTPRTIRGELTVGELCNHFLTHCDDTVETGEMVARTRKDDERITDMIVKVLGRTTAVVALHPDDFSRLKAGMSKGAGPVTLANRITRARVVFRFARRNLPIDQEVQFGMSFDRPSAKVLRRHRAGNGKRMFESAECRRILKAAHTPEIKAMILLGLNAGLGNTDVARLEKRHLDLVAGWLDFPRPKTGIERQAKLWPETVKEIKVVLGRRSQSREKVFVTKAGNSWDKDEAAVSKEFRDVLNLTGLYQPGRNFYALRHTFRTVAGGGRDQVAVNRVMGHVDSSMAAVYRERIDDERLEVVAQHVHGWLWPTKESARK